MADSSNLVHLHNLYRSSSPETKSKIKDELFAQVELLIHDDADFADRLQHLLTKRAAAGADEASRDIAEDSMASSPSTLRAISPASESTEVASEDDDVSMLGLEGDAIVESDEAQREDDESFIAVMHAAEHQSIDDDSSASDTEILDQAIGVEPSIVERNDLPPQFLGLCIDCNRKLVKSCITPCNHIYCEQCLDELTITALEEGGEGPDCVECGLIILSSKILEDDEDDVLDFDTDPEMDEGRRESSSVLLMPSTHSPMSRHSPMSPHSPMVPASSPSSPRSLSFSPGSPSFSPRSPRSPPGSPESPSSSPTSSYISSPSSAPISNIIVRSPNPPRYRVRSPSSVSSSGPSDLDSTLQSEQNTPDPNCFTTDQSWRRRKQELGGHHIPGAVRDLFETSDSEDESEDSESDSSESSGSSEDSESSDSDSGDSSDDSESSDSSERSDSNECSEDGESSESSQDGDGEESEEGGDSEKSEDGSACEESQDSSDDEDDQESSEGEESDEDGGKERVENGEDYGNEDGDVQFETIEMTQGSWTARREAILATTSAKRGADPKWTQAEESVAKRAKISERDTDEAEKTETTPKRQSFGASFDAFLERHRRQLKARKATEGDEKHNARPKEEVKSSMTLSSEPSPDAAMDNFPADMLMTDKELENITSEPVQREVICSATGIIANGPRKGQRLDPRLRALEWGMVESKSLLLWKDRLSTLDQEVEYMMDIWILTLLPSWREYAANQGYEAYRRELWRLSLERERFEGAWTAVEEAERLDAVKKHVKGVIGLQISRWGVRGLVHDHFHEVKNFTWHM